MNGSIIRLSVVDSTNIYTSKLLSHTDIDEWTVVVVDSQSHGKGQRGKTWDSEFGKNLLCSVVLHPNFFKAQEQFLISAAASLAVCQVLLDYRVEASVKWPNDVLVGSHKVAGLLIENQLVKNHIESSIVGLGLNVNQRDFNQYGRPATSIIREVGGETIDIDEVLAGFISHFQSLMNLGRNSKQWLLNAYNNQLAGKGQGVSLSVGGDKISGELKGVTLMGELVIDQDGTDMKYVNGEVSFK